MASNLIEEMDGVALEFVLLDRSLRLMGSLGGRSRIPKGRVWTCEERSGLEVLTALLKFGFMIFLGVVCLIVVEKGKTRIRIFCGPLIFY